MNQKIQKLLNGDGENHILPFFWQHGEDEAILRKYMDVIHGCGIGAVCVESRPHPDFCGPQWWQDMDIILDEARKRRMKVWILDDSHFPTGYANGALKEAPEALCRQHVIHKSYHFHGARKIKLNVEDFVKRFKEKQSLIRKLIIRNQDDRVYADDILLGITANRIDQPGWFDLGNFVNDGKLIWEVPEGDWVINLEKLSRNSGSHRNYINMLDTASCRKLIDAVYEPHFEHYADDFGVTIAGFFSDEPELGNGVLYPNGNVLGTKQPLPWSQELETRLASSIGEDWQCKLCYLWENELDSDETARVRYCYMDAVTRLVEKDFSFQVGDWCREHGVEYIGHVIEDNNQHARTGSSLGHFYRGMAGQDMSGIDDIGGQVYPQGEKEPTKWMHLMPRDGEFYHYVLANLGSSLAAIDPLKRGRTMCEIFGNYGWQAGLRLEKYLADHFLVRGVNTFVPHAFSPKEYPDPDCPPHFYAHGHNPQYRAFGALMRYMNRVSELITEGKAVTPIAILYHGEAEWTGECMLMQKPAHVLADHQINYDFIPTDVFTEIERYKTQFVDGLSINGKPYKALVVPTAEYISADFAQKVRLLHTSGFPVYFIESLPKGIYDADNQALKPLQDCTVVTLENLVETLQTADILEITIEPSSDRLRYLHYVSENDVYMFVNEADSVYEGRITLPVTGPVYAYNAWDNRLEKVDTVSGDQNTALNVTLEPFKSLIVIFDDAEPEGLVTPVTVHGREIQFSGSWSRSTCRSIDYPDFVEVKKITLPDDLAREQPKFSGFVCYDNSVSLDNVPKKAVLEITDAWEGVEVFVNDISVGMQIVPVYWFDVTDYLQPGENRIRIEVSTTLERERSSGKRSIMERLKARKDKDPTGITGQVRLHGSF